MTLTAAEKAILQVHTDRMVKYCEKIRAIYFDDDIPVEEKDERLLDLLCQANEEQQLSSCMAAFPFALGVQTSIGKLSLEPSLQSTTSCQVVFDPKTKEASYNVPLGRVLLMNGADEEVVYDRRTNPHVLAKLFGNIIRN